MGSAPFITLANSQNITLAEDMLLLKLVLIKLNLSVNSSRGIKQNNLKLGWRPELKHTNLNKLNKLKLSPQRLSLQVGRKGARKHWNVDRNSLNNKRTCTGKLPLLPNTMSVMLN